LAGYSKGYHLFPGTGKPPLQGEGRVGSVSAGKGQWVVSFCRLSAGSCH